MYTFIYTYMHIYVTDYPLWACVVSWYATVVSLVFAVQMWCHGIWRTLHSLHCRFLFYWAIHWPHLHLFRGCVVCDCIVLLYYRVSRFLFEITAFTCGVLEFGKTLYNLHCCFLWWALHRPRLHLFWGCVVISALYSLHCCILMSRSCFFIGVALLRSNVMMLICLRLCVFCLAFRCCIQMWLCWFVNVCPHSFFPFRF